MINKSVVKEAISRLLTLFPEKEVDDLVKLRLETQLADRLHADVSLDPIVDNHHIDGEVKSDGDTVRFHIDW